LKSVRRYTAPPSKVPEQPIFDRPCFRISFAPLIDTWIAQNRESHHFLKAKGAKLIVVVSLLRIIHLWRDWLRDRLSEKE
jgi:hypothetical protein